MQTKIKKLKENKNEMISEGIAARIHTIPYVLQINKCKEESM